ncbi:MAG: putative sulfate/molybdate transporter [Alphaproteobacteria bacterium]|nr:putative sulfate/molybdate transporter [Alphaproteobacteria bacterium]
MRASPPNSQSRDFRWFLQEGGSACGDLGTFIPQVIGAITVAGLAPAGVLFGFAAFLIGTGLFYSLPMPVQPMKAVSAVILTGGLRPGEVAAAGLMLGVILLVLGATNAIGRFARLIPQSVSTGLQLGLGLLMGSLGIRLMLETPLIGIGSLALLVLLARIPRFPAAPVTLGAAIVAGWASSNAAPPHLSFAWSAPHLVMPNWPEVWRSFEIAVLPQLSLTLTNAVIVTASLARELFPGAGEIASERNLALSSGLANILLSPFGAMPMCHGAGGLQAQYRFGARTGLAPILFGSALLILAVGLADNAAAVLAIIPAGAVGALLIMAGTDLAVSRRLFDARPSCWPVIGGTALGTLILNPALGLVLGWVSELVRATIVRRLAAQAK